MAHCRGKHQTRHTCNSIVYRCRQCGAVGCNQASQAECSNQTFLKGQCIKCASSEKEPA